MSVLTAPILAHALGVDGRGAVAAATAPLLLMLAAATFGIPEAATYSIARTSQVARWVILRGSLLMLISGVAVTAVVLLLSPLLSAGSDDIHHNLIIASLAITPSLIVALLRGIAMGLHQWRFVAASRGGDALFRLILIAGLALAGHLTIFSATLVIAISPLFGGLLLIPALRRVKGQLHRRDPAASFSSLTSYGVRVWFGAISGVLLLRLDQVLMNPLGGAYELGLYVVAVAISEVPLIVNSAVRDVTFASDAARADTERLTMASRLSTTATFAIAAVLAATIAWWLPVVFGRDFVGAVPIALVLLAAVTVGNPGSVAGAGLSARGRPGLRSTSLLIAAVLNTALLVSLVPLWGAMGAAIATFVGNVTASNLNIYFLNRNFNVPWKQFYAFRIGDLRVLIHATRQLLRR
ncbi:oligosaccharide flippase family protein [Microbacterium soli]|uniref:oligosaccharide flippase family protein n=1 Tax=Microbacterium soli TaxID=446075 RepID=UPI0031DAA108